MNKSVLELIEKSLKDYANNPAHLLPLLKSHLLYFVNVEKGIRSKLDEKSELISFVDDERIIMAGNNLIKSLDSLAIAAYFGQIVNESAKEHKDFVLQRELLILGYSHVMLGLIRQYQVRMTFEISAADLLEG